MMRSARNLRSLALLGLGLSVFIAVGCQTEGQTGSLIGAGVGALAGQAIGGNTKSTLIGAGAGAAAGYIAGDQHQKAKERHRADEARSLPRTKPREQAVASGHAPAWIADSTWIARSLIRDDHEIGGPNVKMTFYRDGSLITRTQGSDGSVTTSAASYSIVAESLVITEDNGAVINASYQRTGDRLIISAPNFRAVLERDY